MTNRERAMNILHYKPADRMPAVHFGYWDELLVEWAEQGKIPQELSYGVVDGNDKDQQLEAIIGWDFNWCTIKTFYHNALYPRFEYKVLETLSDGTQRVQTGYGVIERVKPGITSIPSEDDYLLKDREAFETLFKPKMQFSADRLCADVKRFNETRPKDRPVGLLLGSVMGKIRDITTVQGMSLLMYDEDEELFAEIVDTFAEMQYQCVEAALAAGADVDFGHYWEDICFKNGPLLSPDMFHELCAKHYKKRNDLCHKYGIDIISLDCDGVIEKLIPTWLETGVNVLFPLEVGVWGDQFEKARDNYGECVLGVGGMDKTAFRKDKAAVDAEIERMKRLVSLGGFIPCPDHKLMPGSKFELVQYYAEEIKKISL